VQRRLDAAKAAGLQAVVMDSEALAMQAALAQGLASLARWRRLSAGLGPGLAPVRPMKGQAPVPRINLLPHRQAARRRRIQALLWLLAGGAFTGLLLALGTAGWLHLRLDAQVRRQEDWRRATQQAELVLQAGRRVQDETAALLARRQAIAGLQEQRNAWVHMLEVLARAMPAGVALRGVRQKRRCCACKGMLLRRTRWRRSCWRWPRRRRHRGRNCWKCAARRTVRWNGRYG
jgi:type IV pilus assembly protein PilN